MRRLFVLLACCALLIGCTGNYPPLPANPNGPYRLDSGDVVRVLVYNEPTLSAAYSVGDNGSIVMPILGPVSARGQSVTGLQEEIQRRLRSGNILQNPGVGVEISQYRPFFVVGEVNKPGQYPYAAGLAALGAVADAGGFTVRADQEHFRVVRKADGQSGEWTANPLSLLQPGDVLIVPERFF